MADFLVTMLASSARTARRCLGFSECRTFFRTEFTRLLLSSQLVRVEMFRYEQHLRPADHESLGWR